MSRVRDGAAYMGKIAVSQALLAANILLACLQGLDTLNALYRFKGRLHWLTAR